MVSGRLGSECPGLQRWHLEWGELYKELGFVLGKGKSRTFLQVFSLNGEILLLNDRDTGELWVGVLGGEVE